jgi:GntR family transcriptional regulator
MSASLSAPRRPTRRLLVDEVRDLIIEEFIYSGAVPQGEALPSEMELSARYGVSRATVRGSLQALQHARLVSIRNGVGSIVLARSRASIDGMDQLRSVEAFARREGQTVDTADVKWSEEPADAEAAGILGLAVGSPVLVGEHTKLLGSTPIALGVDRIPAGIVELEVLRSRFRGSALDVLLADGRIQSADSEWTAVALTKQLASRLAVPTKSPAIFLDQLIHDEQGRAVQWAQTWLLPDHFRLTLTRRARSGA